ncbi:hypothetical protein L3i20_v209530 [Paenibacillus sp. L3-i20]|nr:hypothetical protein L3i20_v209530 [Paenibacillus sp. L3-i20]
MCFEKAEGQPLTEDAPNEIFFKQTGMFKGKMYSITIKKAFTAFAEKALISFPFQSFIGKG